MQRQLAQVETARRRFIATASHELRTPIFSLGGFLELLEDEELDDETRREFIGVVRQQVARLGKLATDLLDLSKLEAGSLELRPEPTDLGDLASRVTSEFPPALTSTAPRWSCAWASEPIEADCDPERVAQILRILIDNALTHTPEGTDVVVSAVRDNGAVRLGVCDDGPGIGDDAAARVFEAFFTSDDAQGSGLGLAIARELADPNTWTPASRARSRRSRSSTATASSSRGSTWAGGSRFGPSSSTVTTRTRPRSNKRGTGYDDAGSSSVGGALPW